jgi:hypothetical protein
MPAQAQTIGAAIGNDPTALTALATAVAGDAPSVMALSPAIAAEIANTPAEVQRIGAALAADPAVALAIAPQLHVYNQVGDNLGVYLPGLGLYDPANGTVLVIEDLTRGRLKGIDVNVPVGYFSDNTCATHAFPLDATDGFVNKIMWDTAAHGARLITPNNSATGQLYVLDAANTCYEYPGHGVLTRYTRIFVAAAVPAAITGNVVNLPALRANLPLVIR